MDQGKKESDALQHMLALPDLPEGWRYSVTAAKMDVVHVEWPEHGAISVHLKHRTLDSGWTVPQPAPNGTMPTGQGWKKDLVGKAVAQLQVTWAVTPLADWINHTTDECPVDADSQVMLKLKNGKEYGPERAGDWLWDRDGKRDDIDAYKAYS